MRAMVRAMVRRVKTWMMARRKEKEGKKGNLVLGRYSTKNIAVNKRRKSIVPDVRGGSFTTCPRGVDHFEALGRANNSSVI